MSRIQIGKLDKDKEDTTKYVDDGKLNDATTTNESSSCDCATSGTYKFSTSCKLW